MVEGLVDPSRTSGQQLPDLLHTQVCCPFVTFVAHEVGLLTHIRHGNQGLYDRASNADLDNEFGTHVDVEVIEKVLRQGVLTEGHVSVTV